MSRRTTFLLVMMGIAMLLSSGVALAQTIDCKRDQVCRGTAKADKMTGTQNSDRMLGLGGSDFLYGKKGNDILVGGSGYNKLDGGLGEDRLRGGKDPDGYVFRGDWGNDIIIDSTLNSAGGFYAYRNDVTFTDAAGDLIINLESDSGDVPEATDGVNTVNWSCPQGEDPSCSPDVIDGVFVQSFGDDKVTGNNNLGNLIESREDPANGNPGGDDTLSGGDGEDYIASEDESGNDTLSGGGERDEIYSHDKSGIDTISGGDGEDYIASDDESGNDVIFAGEGNDQVSSEGIAGEEDTSGGNDTVSGEGGDDIIMVKDGFGGDTVDCGEDVDREDTDRVSADVGDLISPNCEMPFEDLPKTGGVNRSLLPLILGGGILLLIVGSSLLVRKVLRDSDW